MADLFRRIVDLPALTTSSDWRWETFDGGGRRNFWVGTDRAGNQWLVKMRGSSYAYREHSFARLAQHLGVSCQSSVYLRLSAGADPLRGDDDTEEFQLALSLLPEHGTEVCSADCPFPIVQEVFDRLPDEPIQALQTPGIEHLMDWARMCMLAELCGANEPSDRLITPDHTFVLIDNEQMFSTGPGNIWNCDWLFAGDSRSELGVKVATDLCDQFVRIKDEELRSFATLPKGYEVHDPRPIAEILVAAKMAAANFLIQVARK